MSPLVHITSMPGLIGTARYRTVTGPPSDTMKVAWVQEEKFTAAFSNAPIVCRSLRSSAFIPLLEATDEIAMSASMSANGVIRDRGGPPVSPATSAMPPKAEVNSERRRN